MPRDPYDVLRDALNFVTVDALVTTQHADDLAEQLLAALRMMGYTLVPELPS